MGSLELVFEAPWLQEPNAARDLEPRVRLRPVSTPHGESLTLAAKWDRRAAGGAGAFVVRDIPAGTYEAWLYEDWTGASFPRRHLAGWTVEIERSQRSQIDATNYGVAAVLLEITDAGGEPYEQGLSAGLLVKIEGRGRYAALDKQVPIFRSAPYLFPFVPVERTGRGGGLYAHVFSILTLQRPPLVAAEKLQPGQLHRAKLTAQKWPRMTRDGTLLAR